MSHGWPVCLLATLYLLAAAPAVHAEHNGRPNVPAGLDTELESAHFVIHYDTDTYTAAKAADLRDDLEESHEKLVTGGTGTPNAGLDAPPADSDGKTDVYIAVPTDWPGFTGGVVYGDSEHFSSYMFMTPGLSRTATRFRSAHEYMHVIQRAYFGGGSLLTESTANWASEWALPDVDPQDAFFGAPFLPLDCSYGTFAPAGGAAQNCGNGYWQWSFMWRLSQRFGVGIIDALFSEVAADCPFGCSTAQDRATLTDVIDAQTGTDTLPAMYAEYARDVWAPGRWSTGPLPTTAMQSIHNLWGEPASTVVTAATGDTGTTGVTVDHLATRYVTFRNTGSFLPTGPNDQLVLDVGRPAGQPAAFRALARYANGSIVDTAADATTAPHVPFAADPAQLRQVIVPLTNGATGDGLAFSYRLQYVHGTPTPPANDAKGGAVSVTRGAEATTNNVYAGGRGNVDEANACPPAQDATRGVWFRFTTEGHGVHTYSAQASDFAAVVSLYRADDGAFAGCSLDGSFAGEQFADTAYDVYVGRRASETGFGTTARLVVNGPPPGPPTLDTTAPPAGAIVNTLTPTFAGTAGNRPGDASTVTVRIWQGNDIGAAPIQTLTTERSGSTWQVAASTPLANGTYVWRAEQEGGTGTGASPFRAFGVQVAQTPTGGGPGTGGPGGTDALGPDGEVIPGPTGGPPAGVSSDCRRARTARTLAGRKLTTARRALKRAKGARKRRAAKRRVTKAQVTLRRATARQRRLCG